ncbi:Armadillo repeat-containing protein 8 [Homalodisca vitripennis]|nr:Armadillo repeat-containing protein 8 [Homalodisca vitripennis]
MTLPIDISSITEGVDKAVGGVWTLAPDALPRRLPGRGCLKNSVIGSNRQKGSVIAQGVVPRLVQLLSDTSLPLEVRRETAVTLGSLAKGTDAHIKQLIDVNVVPLLLNSVMSSDDLKLTEACLRCICSVFRHPSAPVDLIFTDCHLLSHLLTLTMQSITNQICVTTIFSCSCKRFEQQHALCDRGIVPTLAALLCSPHSAVLMPTLLCLTNLTYENPKVSYTVITASFGGKSIPDLVVRLVERDRPTEMQLAAARALTNLHRAGALTAEDPKILYKTLPCLVCLCKKERPSHERVLAAETLAYLTEVDTELQRLASISNHLIPTLADLLHYQPENNNNLAQQETRIAQDMRQAAFRAICDDASVQSMIISDSDPDFISGTDSEDYTGVNNVIEESDSDLNTSDANNTTHHTSGSTSNTTNTLGTDIG